MPPIGNRIVWFAAATLALATGACVQETQNQQALSPCEDAIEHLKGCDVELDGFAEGCTDEDATALLALTCSELESGALGGDREDGFLGYKDKGVGCWFDWQCETPLICRPGGMGKDVCLPRAPLGSSCDEDDDCMQAECVSDEERGDVCRRPLLEA